MRFYIVLFFYFSFLNVASSQTKDYKINIKNTAFYLVKDTIVQKNLVKALTGFLSIRRDESMYNPYVDSTYLKEDPIPFLWLRDAEGKSNSEGFEYIPTILSIIPIESKRFIVKLAFLRSVNDSSNSSHLKLIATLEVRNINNNYFFYSALNHNTRNFNRRTVGSINYIYQNKINLKLGREMDKFNKTFAGKFETKPLKITYYKSDDPEQLFKILGYDYIENMYYSNSGGLAEYWRNTLFAGNGSELYKHEVVHFYTRNLYPDISRLVDEGYATYIGGSGGLELEQLARNAKSYALNNKHDLYELTTNFQIRMDTGVPISYVLAAIICKDLEETHGFEALKKLFNAKSSERFIDMLQMINGVGINKFDQYITRLLAKY